MPAPGADGLTIQRLSPRWSFLPIGLVLFQAPTSSAFLLGPDGGVSFTADVAGGSCPDPADLRRALFAPDGAGGETLIALEGEPLPGAEGPEALRLWSVGLADDGLGSLLAHVDYVSDSDPGPPPLGSLPRSALLRWRPLDGDLATVAREGVPSAFLAGEPIADLGVPRASPGGAVALLGVPEEPDPIAIWIGDADGLEPAVPLSGPVPGAPPGAEFATNVVPLMEPPLVNDAGEVAFAMPLRLGPGEDLQRGLFGPGEDGAPTLRMVTGDPAPGLPELRIATLEVLHLAPSGALLASVELEGESLPPNAKQRAWYLVPRSGTPRLLLRDGEPIELEPGQERSADVGALAYDEELTRIAILIGGASGHAAIAVRAVPEPDTTLAGASALAALALRASRRRARR